MKDVYEKLAYVYDEFGPIYEFCGDEKRFFDRLFTKYHVTSVLDCACGTGQHIALFTQLGYQVQGSDISYSMLEVAKENLESLGYTIPLHPCDFRYLQQKFTTRFDAVVCLTSSLPHLHRDEDLLLALKSMKNRLNEGGLLVLTSGTTHYNLTLPSIELVIHREDFSRIFIKEKDHSFQTIHVVDLYHTQERKEQHQYTIVYRILLDEEYRSLLTQAGFSHIQLYGDYDLSTYDRRSRRLIVVANA